MRENIAAGSLQSASRFPAAKAETLTGARTITVAEVRRWNALAFDPGGAGRTVTLPPEEASEGVWLFVSNEADAAEVLTINNDAAATIVTPAQNEGALLMCNGVIWFGLVGATA